MRRRLALPGARIAWPRCGAAAVAFFLLALATLVLANLGPPLDGPTADLLATGQAQLDGRTLDGWLTHEARGHDPRTPAADTVSGGLPRLAALLAASLGLRFAWLARALLLLALAVALLRSPNASARPRLDAVRLLAVSLVVSIAAPDAALGAHAVDAPALLMLTLAAARGRWGFGAATTVGWLALVPSAWPLALVVIVPVLLERVRGLGSRGGDTERRAISLRAVLGPLAATLGVLVASTLTRGAPLAPWLDGSTSARPGLAVTALLFGALAVVALRIADRLPVALDVWRLAAATTLWLWVPSAAAAPLLVAPTLGRLPVGLFTSPRGSRAVATRSLAAALAVLLPAVSFGWRATLRGIDEGSPAAPHLTPVRLATPSPDRQDDGASGVSALLRQHPGRILEAPAVAGRLAVALPEADLAMARSDSLDALRAASAFHGRAAFRHALEHWRPDHVVAPRSAAAELESWLESGASRLDGSNAVDETSSYRVAAFDDDLVLISNVLPGLETWNPAALGRTLSSLADDAKPGVEESRARADAELVRLGDRAPSPLLLRLRAEIARFDGRPEDALALLDAAVDRVPAGRALPHEIVLAKARALRSAGRPADGARELERLDRRRIVRSLTGSGRARAVERDAYVRDRGLAAERAGMEDAAGDPAAALAAFEARYGVFATEAPAALLRRAAGWAEDSGDAEHAARLRGWADWKDEIADDFAYDHSATTARPAQTSPAEEPEEEAP